MSPKAVIVFLLGALFVFGASAGRFKTPLEKYVNNEDDTFEWDVMSSVSTTAYTAYFLNFTSQQWLTSAESSRPIWNHRLTVCVPLNVGYKTAFLYVDGGNNVAAEITSTTVDPIIDFVCRGSSAVTVRK
jgi:PhoPQ-activated pathogenicity-related protein